MAHAFYQAGVILKLYLSNVIFKFKVKRGRFQPGRFVQWSEMHDACKVLQSSIFQQNIPLVCFTVENLQSSQNNIISNFLLHANVRVIDHISLKFWIFNWWIWMLLQGEIKSVSSKNIEDTWSPQMNALGVSAQKYYRDHPEDAPPTT